MDILLSVGSWIIMLCVLGTVLFIFLDELRNYKFVLQVWKLFRIKMFVECLVIIFLVIFAVFQLLSNIPILQYGWISFFFDGTSGNIVVKPILEGSESNILFVRLLVPLYFAILAYILPFLALTEENIFRKGKNDWLSILKWSSYFGMAHCIFGLGLAYGMALIIAGLFFGFKYKRAYDKLIISNDSEEAERLATLTSTG